MTLFRNQTHQEVWIDRWCHTCFEPHEAARRLQGKDTACPILAKALKTNHKPPEWDRNTRADEMHRTITCNAHQPRPEKVRKTTQHFEDEPLFDETPYKTDVGYVPVEGWPERPTESGVDHA